MYQLLLCALCVALWQSGIAQNSYPIIGARVNGAGYAATCIPDHWSIFNNVAGLAGLKETRVGATYDAMPGFPSFNRMAAAVATPLPIGTIGLGFFRFGDDLYREQLLNLGYANKFGLASVGLRGTLIQYYAEGFGQKSVMSFSAGGIADLTPWLHAGACIINALQPELTEGEKVGTILMAGVSVKGSENSTVFFEAEHELGYKPKLKAGFEYIIHTRFVARTGFNLQPQTGFFGFGFHPKKYHLDYAWSYSPHFVARHHVSFNLLVPGRK